MAKITLIFLDDLLHTCSLSKYEFVDIILPCTCPRCDTGILPTILETRVYIHVINSVGIGILPLFCPCCKMPYIAEVKYNCKMSNHHFTISTRTFPSTKVVSTFPEHITKHFSNFIEIYEQSAYAQQEGLNSICGMGYRKALESLVKEYSILTHPQDKDKIFSAQLSECIKTYIPDPDIQNLAIASTWIGNDETHLVKRNPDYAIDDLIRFIRVLTTEIERKLTIQEAKEMVKK